MAVALDEKMQEEAGKLAQEVANLEAERLLIVDQLSDLDTVLRIKKQRKAALDTALWQMEGTSPSGERFS